MHELYITIVLIIHIDITRNAGLKPIRKYEMIKMYNLHCHIYNKLFY